MNALPPTSEPASGRSPRDFDWDGPVRLPDLWNQLTEPGTTVTFGRIVTAWHYSTDKKLGPEALAAERALRRAFVAQEGRLVSESYFGQAGGCALTERSEPNGKGIIRSLHVVLARAPYNLVEMETACHRLMAVANAVFGQRRSRSLRAELVSASEVLYSAMTRVLRLADTLDADARREEIERAAAFEVEAAKRHVETAILREAGFTYFKGALAGAVIALGLCGLLGAASAQYWATAIDTPGFTGAIVFGALGAVASVFQRLSADRVVLAFAPSRSRMLALGGLRPLVGATFGAVVYFALVGGVLGSTAGAAGPAAAFGLAAVTGFAAGFTERFATDIVKRAGSGETESSPPALEEPRTGG